MTPNDLFTLDYTLRGMPFCDAGLIDTVSMDYTLRGLPEYTVFGTLPYNPNMTSEFTVEATFTADLNTGVYLAASFSAAVSMTGYMNLGVSAKLVNIF